MAKYTVHSENGCGEIKIKPIENGFVVSYSHLLNTKEVFVHDLEELNEWLMDFYRKDWNGN